MAGKLTITRGYSGSGKSTWARGQQDKDTNVVLVSRDDIRRDYLGYTSTMTNRSNTRDMPEDETLRCTT